MTRKTKSDGFTLIEIMVVMAIIGFMLLVMLMAVPALSRANRNSQRREDVAKTLQAVSTYMLHNSAKFPSCVARTCGTDPGLNLDRFNITYYDTSDVLIDTSQVSSTQPATVTNQEGNIRIYHYQRCKYDGSGGGIDTGADYRSIIALYAIETAGGFTSQCKQL